MTHTYVAPFRFCHKCMDEIPLPCPDLALATDDQWQEGEYESHIGSVPDEWTALFGCRECGHIEVAVEWNVGDKLLEREALGRFHNETNCFSVNMQCAKIDCKAPAKLHVNLHAGETAKELIALLRKGFFVGALPCGHQIMPIPEPYYRDAHRVMNRLW